MSEQRTMHGSLGIRRRTRMVLIAAMALFCVILLPLYWIIVAATFLPLMVLFVVLQRYWRGGCSAVRSSSLVRPAFRRRTRGEGR